MLSCVIPSRGVTARCILTTSRIFPLPLSCVQPRRGIAAQVANYIRIRWNEWLVPPLHRIYKVDKVSRARNIVVYRSDEGRPYLFAFGFIIIAFNAVMIWWAYDYFVNGTLINPDEYSLDNDPVLIWCGIALTFWLVYMGYKVRARRILRMYYNEAKGEFTAVTYNVFKPWGTKTEIVKAGTAKNKPLTQYSKFQLTWNCYLNDKKRLLDALCFKYPVYYNVLFGTTDPNEIGKLHDTDENCEQLFRRRSYFPDHDLPTPGHYADKQRRQHGSTNQPKIY